MGSHEGFAQPTGLLPNGLLQNEAGKVTRELDVERWSRAEERAAELVACIQPNQPSEARRKAVVDYVRRLIMNCISCQVFTFGSVPLKTYLPDGDIDLTTFSENENLRDNWAQEVRDKLEIEEKSENAEFQVKEVQFIRAEVKIIKCLIQNIVVDISFNQLGGLCTLCFLDEIDHLINHNHLFKRSVILIKAWCYYESRILGAHHGLISTYALETLVLYIFHVFNNCFAGPLEVLYRFLEFFSNFDWDNFCVSLWGPVRISSLPDMTAEPPRNDNGQLLLNKVFLDACSSVYAVLPPENQNQPFVSKHFNVIDPLRTNNNLGRSVSKGNFYRIRSAFAFGARKLARVFECPNENLIAEINQFFVNTWERHGSGVRPDVPLPDLWPPHPRSEHEGRHQTGIIKKGESIPSASQAEKSVIFHGTLFQPPEDTSHYNEYLPIVTSPRVISHGQSHNIHTKEKYSCGYNQAAISNDALQIENNTALSSGHVSGEHEHFSRHLFVRTRSSPRLIDQSVEDFPRGKRNRFLDSGKNHYFSTSGRGKSFVNAEISTASHRARSSRIPLPLSSVFTSMGYGQRNLGGIDTANGPLVDSSRLSSGRPFPRDVSPSPVLHYTSTVGMASKSEETLESGDDNSGLVNSIREDSDGSWLDQDDCTRRHFNYENGNIQMTQPDDEQAPAAMAYISLSGNSFSGYYMREKHKFFEESQGQIGEDSVDSLPPLSSQGNDNYLSDQNSNMRYMPVSQTSTSRTKPGSESSWDGSSARSSKSRRDKRGRKISTSSAPSTNGELTGGWHHERPSSDRASFHADDNSDWVPLSTVDADMVEKISEPASIWPLYLQNQQLAVSNNSQMSGLDSVMPVAPVLVNSSSSQKSMDNSGLVPITFYPTIFFPVYDFPAETVNSESLTGHSDIDGAIDSSSHVSQTNTEDNDAAENLNQSEMSASSSAKCFSDKHIEERLKCDILNGDFASHWQNLQYGRFCQHTRHRDSGICTSSGTFPQMYSPWEGPERPISSANMDLFARMMGYGPHLVPVSLQPGSCQPPIGLYEYQRYQDEVPKRRNGTGTYLPNSVSYRERESSHSRGQRRNYDHQKSKHGESKANWNVGSNTRLSGYIQGRNQTEKQNFRPDCLGSSETRKDRQRVSHKPEGQNKSFGSSNSVHANSAYGLHGYSSVSSNVVASPGPTVPPVVMFYPYDSNVGGCSLPPNQLKFGSFGQVTFSRENEGPQPVVDPIKVGCAKSHGAYPPGSSLARSSPDSPSRPHLPRSVAPRNILAER